MGNDEVKVVTFKLVSDLARDASYMESIRSAILAHRNSHIHGVGACWLDHGPTYMNKGFIPDGQEDGQENTPDVLEADGVRHFLSSVVTTRAVTTHNGTLKPSNKIQATGVFHSTEEPPGQGFKQNNPAAITASVEDGTRLAVVTGDTRGIGAAISTALKKEGYRVAAVYHANDEAAQAFSAKTGIPAFKFDVNDAAACAKGVADIENHFAQPVDTLVNNAGITRDGFFHKLGNPKNCTKLWIPISILSQT